MKPMNHVRLAGAIATPPELRYTPSGLAVLEVILAGEDPVRDSSDKEWTVPWYHRVTVFGAQAERLVEAPVGTLLLLDGRLDFYPYEGSTGTAMGIVALRVEVLERPGLYALSVDAKSQPRLPDAINDTYVSGHLANDPVLRTLSSGDAYLAFELSLKTYPDSTGERNPQIIQVRAHRELADACSDLTQGMPVYAQGRLTAETWRDLEDRPVPTLRLQAARVERYATAWPAA